MPMYEFYCSHCNTIFTFLSKAVTTDKRPHCPKCSRDSLSRMISRFAVTGRSKSDGDAGGEGGVENLPFDETKMEKAMETLSAEAEHINENDPRQAANLMRKLSDMTGLRLGDKMEEALGRMEAGEDPEAIEAEMGELDEKDLFKLDETGNSSGKHGAKKAPLRDETLYEM
jgi:putative FmdB family regulatory protein